MAELEEERGGGIDQYISIPRGGPIHLPNMVGSLTGPPLFESDILRELEDLRNEIHQDSLQVGEDDLSVDELKIVTEDELVDKAFEVAFRDDEVTKIHTIASEEHSEERTDNGKISDAEKNSVPERSTAGTDAAAPDDTSNRPLSNNGNRGLTNITKKRKRKRKNNQNLTDEESYVAKVEHLVRIKEKQNEDKAAAKLHSFNGSCRTNDNLTISSEKTERITSLKSNNSTKARLSSAHERIQVLQPEKEIILCVEVYHNKKTLTKTQEFLVLGRQFISELRDKIYCLTDQLMERAGQHDASGYFLIEDVFCNDLRDPSAMDYSKPILDWLKDSKKEAMEKWEYILSGKLQPKQKALVNRKNKDSLPRFKALQMHKTRFCDLKFRLGAGYLYCHQGDCRHGIVIRDMRLIHPEDVQNRFAYPIQTFQVNSRIRKCSVCQIFRAKYVTVDDKWAGENPCYFCETCYYMLHYVDGSLLYSDFSVYDYDPE